jgi:hypothetical protein
MAARLKARPEILDRRETVEHPFGSIKCKTAFNNNPSFMLSNALTSLTNRQFPRAALRFQP